MEVQVFGSKKSAETRAALRFFAERRVKVHFVDFAVQGPSKAELQRFAQKFKIVNLIDRKSKRFAELGLNAARLTDERWLDKLIDEPMVLVLPLVRFQQQLALGSAEPTWKSWTDK